MNNKKITILCSLAAFSIYVCTYAFRKGFTAGTYAGTPLLGVDYKIWLVLAQVAGYALSKFIGIKWIAEMNPATRIRSILFLLAIAWAALLGFAIIPAPYNIACFFINGIPLGLIWGLIFSYIEGRKNAELIGAVLCTSFIFSSGVIKTIGRSLLLYAHIPERWMPFTVGLLFVPPLLFFVWLLSKVPPPSAEDVLQRTARLPMSGHERKKFIRFFLPGLLINVSIYVLLTTMRDFRDFFDVEIWGDFGFAGNVNIYSQVDVPVAVIVLIVMSLVILVRDNFVAFTVAHASIAAGFFLIAISAFAFRKGLVTTLPFMYTVTLGLYLAYVPYSIIFFERLIASFRYKSNVGFMIYLADSVGYLGSAGVLLFKQFGSAQLSWGNFFVHGAIIAGITGMAGTGLSYLYFYRKKQQSIIPG